MIVGFYIIQWHLILNNYENSLSDLTKGVFRIGEKEWSVR